MWEYQAGARPPLRPLPVCIRAAGGRPAPTLLRMRESGVLHPAHPACPALPLPQRRLILGLVAAAGLGAFALVPTQELQLSKPSKPLFFYLVPLLRQGWGGGRAAANEGAGSLLGPGSPAAGDRRPGMFTGHAASLLCEALCTKCMSRQLPARAERPRALLAGPRPCSRCRAHA